MQASVKHYTASIRILALTLYSNTTGVFSPLLLLNTSIVVSLLFRVEVAERPWSQGFETAMLTYTVHCKLDKAKKWRRIASLVEGAVRFEGNACTFSME